MKYFEFKMLCNELLIDSEIAIEDEEIVEALKNRDDEKVEELLKNNF